MQIDTALFAFELVLKALQNMQFVPLSEELLFWKKGSVIGSASVCYSGCASTCYEPVA